MTLRAPDGMVIDGSAINRPTEIPPTRAERIKAGMKAEVPQRVQQGPTCGLYALGMVMDFWHQADKQRIQLFLSQIRISVVKDVIITTSLPRMSGC